MVLPSFHSMSRASLDRSRQQVSRRPLLCGGAGQESREGPVSVHLPGHVNARGSFRLMFSHCTAGDWLRTCASASLPVTGSHPPAGRGWGRKERDSALRKAPILAAVPPPEAGCLELHGFWRRVWLVTSPVCEAGRVGISAAATAHPSPCQGPGTTWAGKGGGGVPGLRCWGDSSLSRAVCLGLPLLASPPHQLLAAAS